MIGVIRTKRVRALLTALLGVTVAGSLSLASSAVSAPKADASSVAFYDGFSGTSLGSAWSKYTGHPGGNYVTTWKASNVYVSGGYLNLVARRGSNGTWTAGGVGAYGETFTHGTWTARVRLDKGHGITGVALLWPKHGFPPELDYFEVFGRNGSRTAYMTTTHRAWDNAMLHTYAYGNFTTWHTVSVAWTSSMVRYSVDGRTVTTTYQNSYIPKGPMWPAFQMATGKGSVDAPNSSTPSTVKMQVDWILVTH